MAERAVVAGVGPGLGWHLVKRFAAAGMEVTMAARRRDALDALLAAEPVAGVTSAACDVADEQSVQGLFEAAGPVDVVVFNAGAFQRGGVLDLDAENFERCWRVGCLGGFLVGQAAARQMVPRGAGSILFTGATASVRGSAGFAALAVPKFGLRALAQSMARELGPKGVHVAHVIVDGQIGACAADDLDPATLDPAALAEVFFQLHRQPRSTWTQELDLRPASEKF
ncbi:SDR family NAD(P)-dependent oxidoreductase [Haliangium sp.]|uniref:SDR family NAD(P)-dependent oxidoreductase n=1 Tax=Haliangium sp. TaxID=2663208 RepID=UPI003D0A0272